MNKPEKKLKIGENLVVLNSALLNGVHRNGNIELVCSWPLVTVDYMRKAIFADDMVYSSHLKIHQGNEKVS